MKITITGRKVNLRDNFKERVEKKLSKFDRIFGEEAEANVTVTMEKNRQTVEVTIRHGGMVYRAESTDLEMNDALDQVVDALGRQLRKNKTRLEKRIKASGFEDFQMEAPWRRKPSSAWCAASTSRSNRSMWRRPFWK